jgi:hypothetical protein
VKVKTETLRGRPLEVEGRTLVPIARRISGAWQQAVIGKRRLSGRGGGFVRLRPLALAEREGEEERLIPIPDRTGQTLLGILAVAVIVPLLLGVAVRLARR